VIVVSQKIRYALPVHLIFSADRKATVLALMDPVRERQGPFEAPATRKARLWRGLLTPLGKLGQRGLHLCE
jgi:hypothetical protein